VGWSGVPDEGPNFVKAFCSDGRRCFFQLVYSVAAFERMGISHIDLHMCNVTVEHLADEVQFEMYDVDTHARPRGATDFQAAGAPNALDVRDRFDWDLATVKGANEVPMRLRSRPPAFRPDPPVARAHGAHRPRYTSDGHFFYGTYSKTNPSRPKWHHSAPVRPAPVPSRSSSRKERWTST